MLLTTSAFIATAAMLFVAHCNPTPLAPGGTLRLDGRSNAIADVKRAVKRAPANPSQLTCTAGNSTALPPNVANVDDFWNRWWMDMSDCLLWTLGVDVWVNPHFCSTPLTNQYYHTTGVQYVWYSKAQGWHDVKDCYEKCSPCLQNSIDKHLLGNTTATYDAGSGNFCEMGFFVHTTL